MDIQTSAVLNRIEELRESIVEAEKELIRLDGEIDYCKKITEEKCEELKQNLEGRISKARNQLADEHDADIKLTDHYQLLARKSCVDALQAQNEAFINKEYENRLEYLSELAAVELDKRDKEFKEKHKRLLSETLIIEEDKCAENLSQAILGCNERISSLTAELKKLRR
jgi:predicted ATP-grasp superfamily ATP-dependent carboligase